MTVRELNGKVAVVTGGASGIGRGIAEELLASGVRVVLADIEETVLQATAAEIGAIGVRTDVTNLESVEALAQAALDHFGHVDIVCNNAGIGPMAAIADLEMSDWHWMLDVNLYGVIHGIKVFLPLLKANSDGGFLLNTASIGGLATMPMLGAYSVTKFGVVALTETLAMELGAAGSRVGTGMLIPGPVRSNLGTSKRNRPAALGGGALIDVDLDDVGDGFDGAVPWISAREAGRIAVDAIRDGRLYAVTHPAMFDQIRARHASIAAAFES